jgi:hypothetical protein
MKMGALVSPKRCDVPLYPALQVFNPLRSRRERGDAKGV